MPDDFHNWFLVFLRVGAMFAAFPLFSAQNFPVQLRIALAALIAFLVSPLLPPSLLLHSNGATIWGWIGIFLSEVVVGLLMGFTARMIYFAIDFGAALISAEMGLSLPSAMNPMSPGQSEVLGTLLYTLTTVMLLALDMHHGMLVAFVRSYEIAPAGGLKLGESLLLDVILRSGQVFVIALNLSAPVIAVSFVVTLMLALLSRAVPQMNVFSESFAVRILAGLAVFGLTINVLSVHITNHIRRIPEDILRIARLAAGGQ